MLERDKRGRVFFVFAGFAALFLVVLGKAFKVQVLDRKRLIERSKSQVLREVKVYPKRGNIYDRNGNPLALNIRTYSIFAMPGQSGLGRGVYRELSRIVPSLRLEDILAKVSDRTRYTWLARKIPLGRGQVRAIRALRGVYVDAVPKRVYPNNELASQVVGFVGVDNVGLAGMEYFFDKRLKGVPRVVRYVKDAKGRAVKFEGTRGPLRQVRFAPVHRQGFAGGGREAPQGGGGRPEGGPRGDRDHGPVQRRDPGDGQLSDLQPQRPARLPAGGPQAVLRHRPDGAGVHLQDLHRGLGPGEQGRQPGHLVLLRAGGVQDRQPRHQRGRVGEEVRVAQRRPDPQAQLQHRGHQDRLRADLSQAARHPQEVPLRAADGGRVPRRVPGHIPGAGERLAPEAVQHQLRPGRGRDGGADAGRLRPPWPTAASTTTRP